MQFMSMLTSAFTGIWFGVSVDTYKRMTRNFKSVRIIEVINDLLFWAVQALIFFYILYIVNYGEIRFYFFLALLLGYATYRALLERIYNQVLEWIITFIQYVVNFMIKIIKALVINPSKWLLQLLISFGMIILTVLWKCLLVIVKIVIFPFQWLVKKYVNKFPIPFYSTYKKLYNKLTHFLKNIRNKRDE